MHAGGVPTETVSTSQIAALQRGPEGSTVLLRWVPRAAYSDLQPQDSSSSSSFGVGSSSLGIGSSSIGSGASSSAGSAFDERERASSAPLVLERNLERRALPEPPLRTATLPVTVRGSSSGSDGGSASTSGPGTAAVVAASVPNGRAGAADPPHTQAAGARPPRAVAYVRQFYFSSSATASLRGALQDAQADADVAGLVLDLRRWVRPHMCRMGCRCPAGAHRGLC